MTRQTGTEHTGARRALWISLGVIGVTLGLVVWLVTGLLDPEGLKPRLAAAVKQATGRTLTIAGPVGIKLAWMPTLTLDDVTLSNPPGFSRPEMMRIGRLEVTLALSPLLQRRVAIDRLALVKPDILLEIDRAGHPNWSFTPERPVGQTAPAPGDASPAPAREGFALSARVIRVENARIGWNDARFGRAVTVAVPALTLAVPVAAPMTASGTAVVEGRTVTIAAQAGSFDQFRSAGGDQFRSAGGGGEPWPVTLKLDTSGAALAVEGHFDRPREGRGYVFVLDGAVPEPAVFASLLPKIPFALTAVKAVTAHVEIRDNGTPLPAVQALLLRVASVDADPAPPRTGLETISRTGPETISRARLENVTLSGQGTEPLRFAARLVTPRFVSDLEGTAGTLPWLTGGAAGPVAVDARWHAPGAQVTVRGKVEKPREGKGIGLEVTGEAADPAALLDNFPAGLKAIAFQARLTDAPGPMPFRITSTITSLAGDLSGELAVALKPRLTVSGHVVSHRLDLDMLRPAPSAPKVVTGVTGTEVTPFPPPQPPDRMAAVIPGGPPLPLAQLRGADATLTLAFDVIHTGETDIAGIAAGVSLKDGVLLVEPFTIAAPEQRLSGRLSVDASKTPAPMSLTLQAPGLALKPLLALLRLPPAVTGAAEVRADLTAQGDTPRAIAASLNGWVGVAVQNGKLDAALIDQMLARLRPLRIQGTDITELRCFAVRADVKAGVATVQPLALNTPALIVDGGGDVDLVHETLALRFRPRARIGGTGISVPVRVTGPWRVPRAAADLSGTGALSGLLLGGKDIMGAAGGGDPCPAALARARDAAAPPEPPTAAPPPGAPPAPSPAAVPPPPPQPVPPAPPEAGSPPASPMPISPEAPHGAPLPEDKK